MICEKRLQQSDVYGVLNSASLAPGALVIDMATMCSISFFSLQQIFICKVLFITETRRRI
jgi:hypothetical protein